MVDHWLNRHRKLTDKALETLVDMRGSNPLGRCGNAVRHRRTLPALARRGLVMQEYGKDGGADKWYITQAGEEAIKEFATIAHMRPVDDYDRKRTGIGA